MGKTHICAAMLLLSAAAVSEARSNWIRLGEDARAEIFIDSASIERPPGYVKAWTMLSFKGRQRGGWRSERRMFMFSCKDRTLEWQQSMYMAEPMGEGEFVHARSLNRYGVGDLRLVELDPSTKDKSVYKEAVPESEFLSVFKDLC
ncbi:surface-adhesin E family protein [Noviherbaspirillum malthae]|uniref:surface-adhesin E family protein n=1 Tax=Noviherbaspirillum malthae TaxID=1260987 RepID=UPI00188FF58D|nr:surface-adhesin E family protein [Noviherbaspirillum malthae]